MILKSSGKLIYTPKTHLRDSDRWLILACDDALSEYYRTLFKREFPWKTKLMRPVWGTHISIIRGETIPNSDIWGLGKDSIVNFEYEDGVKDNGEYYWLKVQCDELSAIRQAYGLKRSPQFGFHLTVGRIS